KTADERCRRHEPAHQIDGGAATPDETHAAETAAWNRVQRETVLRHESGLEPLAAAHEHELAVVARAPQVLGHRQRRIEMPSRPAARKQNSHSRASTGCW